MTKESLQKYCDNKGLNVKILYIKAIEECSDYEVIYTFDLTYEGRDYSHIDRIVEPELDELCVDEEDFYFMAKERM